MRRVLVICENRDFCENRKMYYSSRENRHARTLSHIIRIQYTQLFVTIALIIYRVLVVCENRDFCTFDMNLYVFKIDISVIYTCAFEIVNVGSTCES